MSREMAVCLVLPGRALLVCRVSKAGELLAYSSSFRSFSFPFLLLHPAAFERTRKADVKGGSSFAFLRSPHAILLVTLALSYKMHLKRSSLLAFIGAVSFVKVQAFDRILEPEARRLIGINPTDQQCTIYTGSHEGNFDPPILLGRKLYEEKQISGGKVRSVSFSNDQGNLVAHLHTLITQDNGVATWFTMDGFNLNRAYGYYQIDYLSLYDQPTTKLFKVLQGDDCFKFIDPADIKDTTVNQMMAQVFYENGEPHKQSPRAQPKRQLSSE